MPIERILAVAMVAASAALLLRLGPRAVNSWLVYAGTGERRQRDATGQSPVAPPELRDRMALLSESGYHHIGETSLDLPAGRRFAWIMAADDGDSYAILAGGTVGVPLTGIYSAWMDGTWLGTMHPIGTPSDRQGLQVRVVRTTLGDTVEMHRTGFERLRAVHGAPRQVRVIPDMLALDADYRERFGGSRLRPLVARNIVPAVLSAGVLVLALGLLVDSFQRS